VHNIGKGLLLIRQRKEVNGMDTSVDISAIHIITRRLVLRPIAMDDLADVYAYASVPGVGEMAGWKHHESMEETEAILQSMIAQKEALAVVYKADQKMIGTLGLHPVGEEETEAYPQYRMREIGYVLSKAYWGQGLMPEAVRAVIRYCFDTLKLDGLSCCHFLENSQSRRVIEKCGFRYFTQGKFVAKRLNKTFDDIHYILLREEWTDNGTD